MKTMTLVRGTPGAGKSTLTKTLKFALSAAHLEADMYFINDGVYQFDINKLMDAHDWCKRTTHSFMENDVSVIVSNTFTTKKELVPYFEIAKTHGIVPNVITCQGNFKSIHGVPEETLAKMKARFDYTCVGTLFKEFYSN
jgi:predicted ABC-type ATPase